LGCIKEEEGSPRLPVESEEDDLKKENTQKGGAVKANEQDTKKKKREREWNSLFP